MNQVVLNIVVVLIKVDLHNICLNINITVSRISLVFCFSYFLFLHFCYAHKSPVFIS